MLKARRQHQKTKKLLDVATKQAKRLAKQALAGPAVKKEKVKKEKVKKVNFPRRSLADKTRRRAVRAPGKKARPSPSRPGPPRLAYCVESRRPCLSEAADIALPRVRITLIRLVESGSSASVATWRL